METAQELVRYALIGLLAVVFAYVLMRGVSFAYFRSRYEHYRMLRRLKGSKQEDKTNGQV